MRIIIATIAGLWLLAAGTVSAHHSYADFFLDQTVVIEGDIQELLFANPHVILKVVDRDSHAHTATWQAAYQLARTGVASGTLKVGDHVVIAGCPPRDAASQEISFLKEMRRPSDGWHWTRPGYTPPAVSELKKP